ncbi:TANFOR domain-containing protein [Bacteroides pyogenes]|uniref:TANFOR domain-containing protein n=1 Tax=Bacteroides pyogenes TaxID=310300 RepID=UPI001BA5CF5E|nr:TANFOR domain-containing protein [Bacteroides pyogenes]
MVILVMTATFGSLKAQSDLVKLTQSVQVVPPYTNKLPDYFAPGKIVSTIMVSNAEMHDVKLAVRGYIRSADESGIWIGTVDWAGHPITITGSYTPSQQKVYPPYTLTYNDLQQIFNQQRLVFRGITREKVMRSGLPAGMYQVCFEMSDNYGGDISVGNYGPFCSAPFFILPSVIAVEPPLIIQPVDGSTIREDQAKTLQFSWTMPPGALAGTQYKLKIIEVNDPSMNYHDMLRSESYPVFFETTVTGVPTYLYTIANPAFQKYKTYAFVVRAIDPLGKTSFKNDGYSEVNTFRIKSSFVPLDDLPSDKLHPQKIDNIYLNFVSPRYRREVSDTLKVNENENLILAWKWDSFNVSKVKIPSATDKSKRLKRATDNLKIIDKDAILTSVLNPQSPPTVDVSRLIKERKIAKYVLTVEELDANSGNVIKKIFKKDFVRTSNFDTPESGKGITKKFNENLNINQDVKADLKSPISISGKDLGILNKDTVYYIGESLILSKNEAYRVGFRKHKTYRATIVVMHENGTVLGEYLSNKFVISYGEGINMRVKAVLDYKYEGFPAKYPLANTDVVVNVYADSEKKEENSVIISLTKPLQVFLKTDSLGVIDKDIFIPQDMFEGKKMQYYAISIPSPYYVEEDFRGLWKNLEEKEGNILIEKEDLAGVISKKSHLKEEQSDSLIMIKVKGDVADFGNLTAKTNGYRLVINVKKEYPRYNISEYDREKESEDENRKITLGVQDSGSTCATSFPVNRVEPVKELPVILYRKNKCRNKNIPAIEGDITYAGPKGSLPRESNTIVAIGTTTLNAKGDSSTVTFEKLLCTDNENETYYIQAVRNVSGWIEEQSKKDIFTYVESGVLERIGMVGTYSDKLKNQMDNSNASFEEGFISEPQPFRLPVSRNVYYQTAHTDYSIISRKPPTSILKGRLMYAWPSDKNKLRPLANTEFRMITDYVDGKNRSVGAVNAPSVVLGQNQFAIPQNIKGYEDVFDAIYISETDTIVLSDQWLTMAAGKTDPNGYFEIEVVNLNKKGNLGSGTLYPTRCATGSDPGGEGAGGKQSTDTAEGKVGSKIGQDAIINWGPNMYTETMGNAVNGQKIVNNTMNVHFNSATHSYDVEAGDKTLSMGLSAANLGMGSYDMAQTMQSSGGPNPSMYPNVAPFPSPQQAYPGPSATMRKYEQLKRVFRVVIEGSTKSDYFPSKDVVVIQPFEIRSNVQSITHYVDEQQLEVKVYTRNELGKEVKIDGKGVQVTVYRDIASKGYNLPQGEGDGKYKFAPLIDPTYSGSTDDRKNFEHLWSGLDVNEDSEAKPMKRLLLRSSYQIDASSYLSSNVATCYEKKTYDLWSSASDFSMNDDYNRSVEDNTVDPKPRIHKKKITLKKLPSRILVVLKDSNSQMPLTKEYGGRVYYTNPKKYPVDMRTAFIDDYGKVEITGSDFDKMGFEDNKLTTIRFFGAANGYYDSSIANASLYPTGSQHFRTFSMLPGGRIEGRVVTHELKGKDPVIYTGQNPHSLYRFYGVASWLRFNKGKYHEVKDDGVFNLKLPVIPNSKLEIKPKDVGYFDSLVVIKDVGKTSINLDKIFLKRQRHRIQVSVMTYSGLKSVHALPGCIVAIDGMKSVTNMDGNAYFEFENVSVNNYTLIVRGPEGTNFIPKSVSISNQESKQYQRYVVTLNEGSEVSGVVKLDGAPVSNAKVYLDVSASGVVEEGTLASPDANLTYAYSDKNGRYILRGIPVNDQKVNIRAVLDTTFTVEGDKRLVEITHGRGNANFTLKKFGDHIINKVFGFPLTVEKIEKVNAERVKVTGTINWTQGISKFKMKDVTQTIRVEDVLFRLTEIERNKVGIPEQREIKLSGVTTLKLSLMDKYNVQLTSHRTEFKPHYGYQTLPLFIVKDEERGKISGHMQIVDNSFRYPDDYLKFTSRSKFYLTSLEGEKLNPVIDVVTSVFTEKEALNALYNKTSDYVDAVKKALSLPQNAPYESSSPPGTKKTYKYNPVTGQMEIITEIETGGTTMDIQSFTPPLPLYYLSDAALQPISFKLLNFDATANPRKSFINDWGDIQLDVELQAYIPNAKPENFKVHIPSIILDERKVYSASGFKPLEVRLEEWTLEVPNWKFSVEEGGIISNQGRIHTQIIDIPVKQFVLRNDMLVMDKFVMSDLSMGGGKFKLSIDTTKVKPALIYEQKVGRDMRPHWNFSLLSAGADKAASLPKIAYLDNYKVDIDYIEILSNNEMSMQLKQKDKKALLMGNSMAQFEPEMIVNGADDIRLVGRLNIGAPRLGDLGFTAVWKSPTSKPTFEPVTLDFETRGFVHFVAKESPVHIDKDNIVVLNGEIQEKPTQSFSPMKAHFFCRNKNEMPYIVKIKKGITTGLNSGYDLVGTNGGMYVPHRGMDWTLCRFNGWMTSKNTQNHADIKPSFTEFTVLGMIKAVTFEAQVDAGLKENMTENGSLGAKAGASYKLNVDIEKPDFVQNIEGEMKEIEKEFDELKKDAKEKYEQLRKHTFETPLGEMTQEFDFPNGRLLGAITMKNVMLGGMTVHSGTIETCVDRSGFYIAGGCNAFVPLGILSGNYNIGFMLGCYPLTDHLWNTTNRYIDERVRNKCYKCETSQLKGIYTAFNRELLNVSWPYYFPPVGYGYVKAFALVGGDMYFNVDDKRWKLGMGAYGYLDAKAYLSMAGLFEIEGGVKAKGKMNFELTNPFSKSYIRAHIGLDFRAKACITFPIRECLYTGVSCSVRGGSDGFHFLLNGGPDKLGCNCPGE